MNNSNHTFHIPVMGLSFTIDTPVKVSKYGISSCVSIIQDHLIEQMREYYCQLTGKEYLPISTNEVDYRAKRITSYLNLLNDIIEDQISEIKSMDFDCDNDLDKYFRILPENSTLRLKYKKLLGSKGREREDLEKDLKESVFAGSIDVNIMTKVDRLNKNKEGEVLPPEFADAMSALRGYAMSDLNSSIVFSAGLNPRLYTYIGTFPDFFPNESGEIKKKVILKVSDYRSALIQGKFLANKGIWVSEYRIESGLNCGGHVFPTEGRLLGPILNEFKVNREAMHSELLTLCNSNLKKNERGLLSENEKLKITVQGGIGTFREDVFLKEHYNLDSTGWGSPFLLVPEATNLDRISLSSLINANQNDYFLSNASPLGLKFNNFRSSSAEEQRIKRINKNRPGSPCYLKYLAFNTEFTPDKAICVASREYQKLKLDEIENSGASAEEKEKQKSLALEKDCLCEGLSASVQLKNSMELSHNLKSVTLCPGPNLAFFSKEFSLEQMIGHIYGRLNILNNLYRPHMFLNELKLYIDYLKNEMPTDLQLINKKRLEYFNSFVTNLKEGIAYYYKIINKIEHNSLVIPNGFRKDLDELNASFTDIFRLNSLKGILS